MTIGECVTRREPEPVLVAVAMGIPLVRLEIIRTGSCLTLRRSRN